MAELTEARLKELESRNDPWRSLQGLSYRQAVDEVDGVNHLYDLQEASEMIDTLLATVRRAERLEEALKQAITLIEEHGEHLTPDGAHWVGINSLNYQQASALNEFLRERQAQGEASDEG